MECIVCKKKFSQDDDVVVCETCGTPYHRDCYKSVGKCINTEYHAKGWTFNEMHRKVEKVVTIDDLTPQKENDFTLDTDYDRVVEVSNELIDQINLDPNEDCNGVTLLEFYLYTKSLMGTKKFHKYSNGKKVSSLLAFVFPAYYLASKRLYVQAVVAFLIDFVITIPMMMMSIPEEISQTLADFTSTNVFSAITLVALVLDLVFRKIIADKSISWHFDSTVKSIKNIKQKSHPQNETFKNLIDTTNSVNFLAVFVAFICNNIAYYSFVIVLILIISYFG